MRKTALLFLAGSVFAGHNPSAGFLEHERYEFCHNPEYGLTGKDARWCPLVGSSNAVCPSLPAACAKPPQPIDIEITLGGSDAPCDSDRDGDCGGDVPDDPNATYTGVPRKKGDSGDGDPEGKAARGAEVRWSIKNGGGGTGNGSGNGSGNGDGSNGSGNGTGSGSISGRIGGGNGSGSSGSGTGSGTGDGPNGNGSNGNGSGHGSGSISGTIGGGNGPNGGGNPQNGGNGDGPNGGGDPNKTAPGGQGPIAGGPHGGNTATPGGTAPQASSTNKPPAQNPPEKKPDPPPPPPPPPPEPPPEAEGMSRVAQVLLFVIIGIGVGLIARAIYKHLSWRKKKDDEDETPAAEAAEEQSLVPEKRGPVETDVERLLRRAQAAAQRGDYAKAVEDAHAALLRRLDGAGLIEIHPSRTNGDYVRALHERPDLRKNVRDIVRDVERVQFGSTPPSAQIFQVVFDRVVPIATRAIGIALLLFAAGSLSSCDLVKEPPKGETTPYGTAALEQMMEDAGRSFIHRTDPLSQIEDEDTDKVLLILRGAAVNHAAWRRVIEWVNAGGTLVVAGVRHLPSELSAEPTDDDDPQTHLTRAGTYEYHHRFSTFDVQAPPGAKLRTSVQPASWVLQRNDSPYAVSMGIGKGRAFVFAERALFVNIAFTVADNAAFARELLDDLGKDDIEVCDVWTDAGAENPFDAMRKANLLPVIAQLLAIALLFLVWKGAHFGRPRDPAQRSRRAFADHVQALGHIYQRAKASDHALGNFSAWAIERLRERYYRGQRSGLSPLAEAIAARTGRDETEVMRVLVEAQSARESSGPPSSFRPDFRPDHRPPLRGTGEERDLRLIRALFDYLRVNKDRTGAPKKTS